MPTSGPTPPRSRQLLTLNALDVQILRFINRFTYARGCHLTAWTGASPWTVRKRLRRLVDHRLVRSSVLSVHLRDRGSRIVRPAQAHVWRVTGRGADFAGSWVVPGTQERLSLPAGGGRSRLTSDHVLGVADLAGWYRAWGFDVAAEREVLSLERLSALPGGRLASAATSTWSVELPQHRSPHAPDAGAVHPDGGKWAIELERATKSTAEYHAVIAAYRTAQLGQVWHVLSDATLGRLRDACLQAGVSLTVSPDGTALVSHDGLVRLQGWLPGVVVGPRGPADWPRVPRVAPAGFARLERVDLTASWAYGRVIDLQATGFEDLGGILL